MSHDRQTRIKVGGPWLRVLIEGAEGLLLDSEQRQQLSSLCHIMGS